MNFFNFQMAGKVTIKSTQTSCSKKKKKRLRSNLLDKIEGILPINYVDKVNYAIIKFENLKFKARIYTNGLIIIYGKDDDINRHYADVTVNYLHTQSYKAAKEPIKTNIFLAFRSRNDLMALANFQNFTYNDNGKFVKYENREGTMYSTFCIYEGGSVSFFASDKNAHIR